MPQRHVTIGNLTLGNDLPLVFIVGPNTLVVSITRAGETLFPRAETQLEADDVVMILADPESEGALRAFLNGAAATPAGNQDRSVVERRVRLQIVRYCHRREGPLVIDDQRRKRLLQSDQARKRYLRAALAGHENP